MEVKKLGDLIIDELGNYYHVVDKQGNTVTIANAFMELSFRRKLDTLYIEDHEGEYVGEHAMNLLKGNIERIKAGKNMLKIIPLRELQEQFEVKVQTLFERP